MKEKIKKVLKGTGFAIITFILVLTIGNFFQPLWLKWNNFYTQKGFYEEPKNSVETVFLGPSTILSAVNPTLLYEEYGICSYNLASEMQPVSASYYWAKEAYRLHKRTLKNIVFSVSELRGTLNEKAFHKGIDNMKLSQVKFEAFYDFYDGDIEKTLTEGIFSLGSYHTRWQDISEDDFNKLSFDKVNGTRGYYCTPTVWIGSDQTSNIKNVILDESAEKAELNEDSLSYFNKLVGFCREKEINLILIKTPAENWDSSLHNAVAGVAEECGLPFYDFNFAPLFDELDFIDAFDCADKGTHMNFYGASKFSRYIGKILTENCDVTDVRNDPGYSYLEEHVKKFDDVYTRKMNLQQTRDAADYIVSSVYEGSSVFITVKDAAAKSFTASQREKVKALGLIKLSEISSSDSYIGVIENGKVVYEEIKAASDTENNKPLEYSGSTSDRTEYALVSGGHEHGNTSSCKIDGEEQSKNYRGLNITVYDNSYHTVIDSARFDTYLLEERSVYDPDSVEIIKNGKATEEMMADTYFSKVVERYNAIEEKRTAEKKLMSVKNNYIFDFLDSYRYNENVIIVLAAKDEISQSLTAESRKALKSYGLSVLSEIGFREPYVCVIDGENIVYEKKGTSSQEITYENDGLIVKSSGFDAGNTVSVIFGNEECSTGRRGINAVVYDTKESKVLESVFFDTYSKPVRISE